MAPEQVEAKVETGAAVSRMMTGSILAFVASLVGLIRPDRRGGNSPVDLAQPAGPLSCRGTILYPLLD